MATSEDYDSYTTHPLADLCECAIHMGLLQQPKLLHCGHSFCLDCLQKIHNTEVTKCLYPSSEVRCPTCTQQHQLPTGGIPKLPVDFKSNQLIEIITRETKQQLDVAAKESHTVGLEVEDDFKLCTICKEEGQNVTGVQYCITCSNVMCDNCLVIHDRGMQQHVKVPLEYDKVICESHKTRFVNRYCLQCCTPVCMICIMRDHSQHESAEFIRSDQTKHEQIQALRERLTQMESSLQSKLKSITATKAKNSSDYSRTKQDITSCISNIKTQLDREHELMIAQLDNYHSDTCKHIAFSEVRTHELLKSISDVTLQLNQLEYPIGIDSVTLIRHPSIKGYLETSSEIEKGHSFIVEKLPSYQYTAGSANPGILTIRDMDTNTDNAKTDASNISTTSKTRHITGHEHNPSEFLVHNIHFSDHMEPPKPTTKSKQTYTFPVEKDLLHFVRLHHQDDLRKVKGIYEIHCAESSDPDECVNVWFADCSGNPSQKHLKKFIRFYQDVYTTITWDTLSLGPVAAVRIDSEFKAMGVPCLLKEISTGIFRATYYNEQEHVVRDVVQQILKSTGAPSVKEAGINSYVSSGPLTVRLPPERASNTVTAGTGSRHATPYGHHPSGFLIHNKIEVFHP